MSVATEFAPEVYIPAAARQPRPQRLATVTVLHRPPVAAVAAPVRLTRRGVAAVSVLVGLLAGALVVLAWLSAPPAASSPARGGPAQGGAVPAAVVVRAGDTLWSIATRVAPNRDPRAEIAELVRRNDLTGSTLVPGQVLRTR